MKKQEFLDELRLGLKRFPKTDIDETVSYFDEMIDDKIANEHISEETAVEGLGNIKNVVNRCSAELVAEKCKPNLTVGFRIAIWACASPILLPIAIAALAVLIAAFIVVFAVVVSFGAGAVACIMAIIAGLASLPSGAAIFTIGLSLVGFALCALLCCLSVSIGAKLIKKITVSLAQKIIKKEKTK